jgi:putative transposase
MLNMTWEFKLNLTSAQALEIERTLTVCRKVWNYALRERKDWLNSRKCPINACSIRQEYIIPADAPYPNYHIQAKRLTIAKETIPELKSVNAQVLQQVLRTLDRAFEDMRSKGLGFPRFKKKLGMRSFVFPQFKTNPCTQEGIKLPALGLVDWRMSRPIPEGFHVKQARIVRKASGYFVMLSLQSDLLVPKPNPHGHPIGIDVGLDKFLATSEGELIDRPKFFNTLQRKLELLQRRLKNKKLGSKNRYKLNRKIARLHQTISDTRKDWHYKTANKLCSESGMIFVEDINFSTWAKGMFGKHTLDAGFGQFFNILEWSAWKNYSYFAKVNKDYTSQVCPNCDAHTGKKELNNRVHSCPECGYTTHRDVAAAQVIRNRGVNALGHSVSENVCREGLAGTGNSLVKSQRNRKLKS